MKSESKSSGVEVLENLWTFLPENVLVKIFQCLSAREILNCSECCKRWSFVSRDPLLWKKKFKEDFKVDREIKLKPSESWLGGDCIRLWVGEVDCLN
jgi:hypothetical protein